MRNVGLPVLGFLGDFQSYSKKQLYLQFSQYLLANEGPSTHDEIVGS
ncbi:hypothetical protein VCHA43P277_40137 [Vibrio chagasii]|nr:hypothetical protein VCHA35O141_30086 [Vibrio chagasii]CAH6952404.1 hypothetical protein VCHA35O143_30155 [Vibrio chagasii]CAH6991578.1 hypothetical protein VCHA31O73_40088 [Vibrio chagasii]CAH7005514.1 hypothetical protein VCHA34P126_50138 [Vibrio chagasii]CAH7158725.1 hypothetical protein VCHA38P215_20151 [Vibrio chagasii]